MNDDSRGGVSVAERPRQRFICPWCFDRTRQLHEVFNADEAAVEPAAYVVCPHGLGYHRKHP